ncbi:MAG: tRNA lysidine(34) synthetase TilS [Gammaproteobacteria bacterium]
MGKVTESLQAALKQSGATSAALCVAFSGGRDSTTLLHSLARLHLGVPLRAIHIDHAMHPDSARWAEHCLQVGRQLEVPVEIVRVQVAAGTRGPEAAAREARYAALRAALQPGEYLLTAHHRDDQLETVLLRLMRGSGPVGIAGIRTLSSFAPGYLLRPLLELSGSQIQRYAVKHELTWLEDPSNADVGYDRNYLRQEVIPRLSRRWPAAAQVGARAARLGHEAAQLLDELAVQDAVGIVQGDVLELTALRQLSGRRQRNLLRSFLRQRDLPVPGEAALDEGLAQLLQARADGAPRLAWPGGELRRYRERLYLLSRHPDALAPPASRSWDTREAVELGPLAGSLAWLPAPDAPAAGPPQLTVRFRRGGERLQRHGCHVRLKNLFQAAGIVPWMRPHVPLIYAGEELLTVGDLWYADDWAHQPWAAGARVHWSPREALR